MTEMTELARRVIELEDLVKLQRKTIKKLVEKNDRLKDRLIACGDWYGS